MGMVLARSNNGQAWAPPGNLAPMSDEMIAPAGGGTPHNNMMPYLTLNFCIAMQGVFPPRG
jgi:microcystin-dependent protein